MPTMKLRTRQEVEDFVRGCTFYGTGGGGLPANGVESLTKELEADRRSAGTLARYLMTP